MQQQERQEQRAKQQEEDERARARAAIRIQARQRGKSSRRGGRHYHSAAWERMKREEDRAEQQAKLASEQAKRDKGLALKRVAAEVEASRRRAADGHGRLPPPLPAIPTEAAAAAAAAAEVVRTPPNQAAKPPPLHFFRLIRLHSARVEPTA